MVSTTLSVECGVIYKNIIHLTPAYLFLRSPSPTKDSMQTRILGFIKLQYMFFINDQYLSPRISIRASVSTHEEEPVIQTPPMGESRCDVQAP